MRRLLAITAFFGALLVSVTAARAEPQCGLRENFLRQAQDVYQEAPAYAGVAADGRLFEIWATESGSTWTALVTHKTENGESIVCMVASGDNWRPVEAAPAGTGL